MDKFLKILLYLVKTIPHIYDLTTLSLVFIGWSEMAEYITINWEIMRKDWDKMVENQQLISVCLMGQKCAQQET